MPPTPISAVRAIAASGVFVVSVVVSVAVASAQGRSDAAPGQQKAKPQRSSSRAAESGVGSPVTASAPTSAPVAAANAVVYYGSWLDDASIVNTRDVWVGLATGVWRGGGHRQIDAPVASVAVGLGPRVQTGGSASFYHFRDADGLTRENGFGNLSVYGKFQIITPEATSRSIGVAVTPLLEFLPGSGDRFGWALPVNVEVRHSRGRVYGSGGYFSRGSVFASAASEWPIGDRISLTGTFGQSYASAGSRQTSLGLGMAYFATATSGVFVGFGQTFMPSTVGPGGISVAGGMSFLLPSPAAVRKP